MLGFDLFVDLAQCFLNLIVQVSVFSILVVAAVSYLLHLFFSQIVGLLELFFEALAYLHERHLVASGEAALLGSLAHVAEVLNEALSPKLLLEEVPAFLPKLDLFKGEKIVVAQVNLKSPLEHEESLIVKVLR